MLIFLWDYLDEIKDDEQIETLNHDIIKELGC